MEEQRLGIGRLFEPKGVIGPREAFVSKQSLRALHTSVGESMTLKYDIKLILNMLQQLTGQMFPAFLTKETTLAEL